MAVLENVEVFVCDHCEREVVNKSRGLPKGWYELCYSDLTLHFDGHGCLMAWAESK